MPADFTVFGDSCPGEKKVLAVKVQCSRQESPEESQEASAIHVAPAQTVVYRHSVTIPVGTAATVVIPALVKPASATVTEGGKPLWKNNAFVPGVDGVGSAGPTPEAIHLAVAQGSYVFELLA